MNNYVIIPCGGQKLPHAAHADELYTGSMFQDTLRTALMMTDRNNIFILSAKYGLVMLDVVLPPYDLKMGDPGSVTPGQVQRDLREMLDFSEPFTISALLPKAYLKVLRDAYNFEIENCFEGCKGIGYQKARLAEIRKAVNA